MLNNLKHIEIMLDTYDDHSPLNPINTKDSPELTELEQLQEDYVDLRSRLKEAKTQLQHCIDLAELGTNTLLLNKLKSIKL